MGDLYHDFGRRKCPQCRVLLSHFAGTAAVPSVERKTEFSTQVPVLFNPIIPAVASARKKEVLRQMLILNGTNLEQLSTGISSHHIEADINTLFHLHASALQHASKNNWTAWVLIVASVVSTLFILCYFAHSCVWKLRKVCIGELITRWIMVLRSPKLKTPVLHTQIPLVWMAKT
jgi:hypothetical protein